MKLNGIFPIAAVLFAACGTKTETILKVELRQLEASEIYEREKVSDVLFDAQELGIDSLRNKSRELFLKGIDHLKNKRDAWKAVDFFKKSILIFPDGKTYYELGNALSATGNSLAAAESIRAYDVAIELEFQPLSEVYFRKASVSAKLDAKNSPEERVSWRTISALQSAFSHGFADTFRITENPIFSEVLRSSEYYEMLAAALSKNTSADVTGKFALFLKAFPEKMEDFIIAEDAVNDFDYAKSISYEFAEFVPEMENVSFGRDVSHDFFYAGRIAGNANYFGVVYASVSFVEANSPVQYVLATYTPKGEIVSRKIIACSCSPSDVKSCRINGSMLDIIAWKRIWDKPFEHTNPEQNKVKEYQELAKASFKIDDNGKIIEDEVSPGFNDSDIMASGK